MARRALSAGPSSRSASSSNRRITSASTTPTTYRNGVANPSAALAQRSESPALRASSAARWKAADERGQSTCPAKRARPRASRMSTRARAAGVAGGGGGGALEGRGGAWPVHLSGEEGAPQGEQDVHADTVVGVRDRV